MKEYFLKLFLILLFFGILITMIARVTCSYESVTVGDIENAIIYLVEKNNGGPNHKIFKDVQYRQTLAQTIKKYAQEYNVPPLLIVVIIYNESSFIVGKKRTRGKKYGDKVGVGESGLMQVCPMGRRYCECIDGLDGEVKCGTCWLAHGIERCGSLEKGLNTYVGRRCKGNLTVRRIVENRINLWQKIKWRNKKKE